VNVRKQVLVSAGTIGAMLAAAAWTYRLLPAQLAVRWNIHGEAAGFLDRGLALLIIPAIAIALTAFFAFAPTLLPARSRLERSSAAWAAVWMVTLASLLFGQILMITANLGLPLDIPRLCSLCVAIVIFVTGNWFGKVRYNTVFGLRTPWTVADERVWDKTHRFAGRLMVLAAVVLAAAALTLPAHPPTSLVLCAAIIACACVPALAAIIYSALISRRS
jgi:uncharacterized membrane protein